MKPVVRATVQCEKCSGKLTLMDREIPYRPNVSDVGFKTTVGTQPEPFSCHATENMFGRLRLGWLVGDFELLRTVSV